MLQNTMKLESKLKQLLRVKPLGDKLRTVDLNQRVCLKMIAQEIVVGVQSDMPTEGSAMRFTDQT